MHEVVSRIGRFIKRKPLTVISTVEQSAISTAPGAYSLLERMASEKPLFTWVNIPSKNINGGLLVSKEVVCEETGGSCMDIKFSVRYGPHLDYHGHITDQDRVVDFGAFINGPRGTNTVRTTGSLNLEDILEIAQQTEVALAKPHGETGGFPSSPVVTLNEES